MLMADTPDPRYSQTQPIANRKFLQTQPITVVAMDDNNSNDRKRVK